jgi:hypothetical protein
MDDVFNARTIMHRMSVPLNSRSRIHEGLPFRQERDDGPIETVNFRTNVCHGLCCQSRMPDRIIVS